MTVAMTDISKSFGANLVLDRVDFSAEGGKIAALLGENGAGKSTLMNILGGVIHADGGSISIDGRQASFLGPRDAINAGIAFIHQELNLINDLAVYENLFIGRELKTRRGFLDTAAMKREAAAVFERMDVDLDCTVLVRSLDASYKQIVEICRAMMMDARVIIMDEPTSSLTEAEIGRVFAFMRALKEKGSGLVFISHKLDEVTEICDTYTVLRDGKVVSSAPISSVAASDLARMMVGHDVAQGAAAAVEAGEVALEAKGLSDGRAFSDVSFAARRGEVVGFTGLLGDGRSELFLSIFGAGSRHTGSLLVNGVPAEIRSPSEAVSLGLGYVPRNRKENGIVKDLNILENGSLVTMKKRKKGPFLDWAKIRSDFEREREELSIKMESACAPITSLSGGNQQKVVLAKWLSAAPSILVLDNPTQGVDVGAKEEIYAAIAALAQRGVAVIVLSSEAQEIARLSRRCYVMYHGKIAHELSGDDVNEHEIMKWATGAAK